MTLLVPIVMFGWIPLVLMLMLIMPPRRSVAIAFIGGWLFLPEVSYPIQGLPDYTKISATCAGILLGTVLFHWERFRFLRLQWTDLPMFAWCCLPIGSSVSNGLGLHDGISCVLQTTVTWGFPYLVGRLHFNDADGLRFLAKALFVGGLVYVPFCLWEIKMSPQLNSQFYGFRVGAFRNVLRYSGYRPEVFMASGLMVGMWMCTAAVIGIWLWRTRSVGTIADMPVGWFVLLLVITAVLCKSFGALALLALGLAILWATVRFRTPVLIYLLVVSPLFYCVLRGSNVWTGEGLLAFIETFDTERAHSLRTRFDNENVLVDRAMERPFLGWGGFGRNRVYDPETGDDITITDGYWVIVLGTRGIVSLATLLVICALPPLLMVRRVPVVWWASPGFSGAAVLAVGLLLYSVDNLLNAMINPVFMLCAGGLTSLYVGVKAPRRVAAARVRHAPQHAIGVP